MLNQKQTSLSMNAKSSLIEVLEATPHKARGSACQLHAQLLASDDCKAQLTFVPHRWA